MSAPHTPTTPTPRRLGESPLIVSALAMAVLLGVVISPLVNEPARAEMVAESGHLVTMTAKGGNEDLLLVLDNRTEQLTLYKVGQHYYGDEELARWAVVITALLPLSYFFAAPMSESIYLAMTLGLFYFGTRRRWLAAAVCGLLATLARSQGILLLPVAGLLLLEQNGFSLRRRDQWLDQTKQAVAQGVPLLLIPLGFIGFNLYRANLGLPSLDTVYSSVSYIYLTNPLDGLLANLRWIVERPAAAIATVDVWALVISLILACAALRFPRHRRLPLVAYNFGFILFFVSKGNYVYGTQEVMFTQSFGRYALALFPLTFLAADGLRSTTPLLRVIGVALLVFGIVAGSALYVLALTGP